MAITEMYTRIPWELVADPLRSVEHTLATTYPEHVDYMGILTNLDYYKELKKSWTKAQLNTEHVTQHQGCSLLIEPQFGEKKSETL